VLPPAPGDTAGEAEEFRKVEHGEATPYAYQVANAADAQRVVAESKKVGTEFLKIHNALTPDPYFAIAAEAKKQGMYMTGHVPTGVSVAKLAKPACAASNTSGGCLKAARRERRNPEDGARRRRAAATAARQSQSGCPQDAVQSFSADKCAKLASVFVKNDTCCPRPSCPKGASRPTASAVQIGSSTFPLNCAGTG
jgi:hypothetical protein